MCSVEGCEEEFSDVGNARKHYVRCHLEVKEKQNEYGTFLLFEDQDTFELFTGFPYEDEDGETVRVATRIMRKSKKP